MRKQYVPIGCQKQKSHVDIRRKAAKSLRGFTFLIKTGLGYYLLSIKNAHLALCQAFMVSFHDLHFYYPTGKSMSRFFTPAYKGISIAESPTSPGSSITLTCFAK